ncbi:heparinase II/III family protein [Prosthecobacter sp.]|uniref:heparinase II/III domain-containing protein n=1 Tax=Prosthecobacter sp. TaxID=1965333 RepID=UPI0024893897|nr:heparinase II/III family protein [Prosthecobacter sp.]MDI1315061.1 heparinase II/III family protein [Prosthecobacter sp.]
MKTVSRFLTLASVCLIAATSATAQLAEEFHTWTNTSGKTVEATLISVDAVAKMLKIKTKDGREFDVAIASLSAADFEYAKGRYAAMQAAPAAAPAVAMPATPAGTPPAAAPKAGAKTAAAVKKPAPPRPAITVVPVSKFKAPSTNDYLSGIAKVRPRLIHNAAGWAALKGQIAADPVLAKMMEAMKASGEDLLLDPELTRINGETGGEGPKAVYRMGLLGALHFCDGDLKWQDKGTKELIALTDKITFRDWHPDLIDNLTDLVVATSLGYDWFRAGLNAEQAAVIRTFMTEKGIGALIAHLEGEEIPESAKGTSGGQTGTKSKAPAKAPAKAQAKPDVSKLLPDSKQMAAASALLISAICLADEDPAIAKKAADAAAKVFGKGIVRFAPAGVWPEGLQAGETVMDYVAMLSESLKAASGRDLNISLLEGIPQFNTARMHMMGPSGQTFNFGDSTGAASTRPWVATWLCGIAGNPGIRAVAATGKQPVTASYFGQVGNFIYYNPHAAGDGTADSMDYAQPGGFVATSRSGWEKTDYFIAVKGGENENTTAQLDIGSFVMEAGGQRWGIELGAETDKAPGFEVKPGADRTRRFELYLENTLGQNTLVIDGSQQELDAKAAVLLGASTPELGLAVVDMTRAYSKPAKDVHRGVMVVRGVKPYIVVQDDLLMKNTGNITWSMHTMAEISATGTTAKLTLGGKTLVATIVSPASATFSAGIPPEPATEQSRDLVKANIHVLKASVDGAKGPQSLCITFAMDEAPVHTATPVATWVKK